MRDLRHDAKLDGLVRQKPQRPAIPSSWRFGASEGDQVRFGAPLQRALVDPIGFRAFQRSLEASLVKAFARSLYGGRGGLEHLGDLSVAEHLSLGVFAYEVGFEQDAGSIQLTRGGVPAEMSLWRYARSCSVSSTRYFFFIAAHL